MNENNEQDNTTEMIFEQIKAITTFQVIQASLDDLTDKIAEVELLSAQLAEQAIVIDQLVALLNKEKEGE
jgi:hypothetical protein